MAKDSKLYNIGDSIIVTVEPIVSGVVSLTGFTDELNGITLTRTVKREYRIQTEDIFDSGWLELTNDNLATFSELIVYGFKIEVKYTRTGSDITDFIEFVDINFAGNFNKNELISPTISNSIFKDVIKSNDLKIIENNLFKKLYKRGIIPKYIKRGENNDKTEDYGFFVLFSSVAKFFAMLLKFIFRFNDFLNDYDLMLENVNQDNLAVNDNISIEDLQYLSNNYYDEIRKRGTEMIFKRKGEVLNSGSVVGVDGELLRLFNNKRGDEMVKEVLPLQIIGWCLSKSSPMYKGVDYSKSLNKTGNIRFNLPNTDCYQDYVLSNSSVTYGDPISEYLKDVKLEALQFITTDGVDSIGGIGRLSDEDISDKLISVSTNLDYEITFYIKKLSDLGNLKFGLELFDYNKEKIVDGLVSQDGDLITDNFFIIDINKLKNDEWYFVRGIIFGYSTKYKRNITTNIGFGNNLIFINKFVKYIYPKIQFESNSGSEINIANFYMKPLIWGTAIGDRKNSDVVSQSIGFMQSYNLLYLYIKNNNNSKNRTEIEDFVEKYLLPYNIKGIYIYV